MNKAFEKILERLEEMRRKSCIPDIKGYCQTTISRAEAIVQEVAEEYNNSWIPCSERLPEESGEYLTWVEYDGDRFRAIDEIDCDGIIKEWNCSTDYKIIAWQPLPEPFKESD